MTDKSGERTFLTANCSFVTSFPSIVGDPVNDQGLFRIGVSDGIAAAVNLGDDINSFKLNDYNTEKEEIEELLKDNEKNAVQIQEKENAYAKNQSIIYKLFEKSIDNILKKNSDDNTVVGMQELNNTEQVHNTIQDKLSNKGRNSFFVCNNVHDPTGGTYATLGYILPQNATYMEIKADVKTKIFRNTRENYGYDKLNDETKGEKIKSYSVDKGKKNIMAIRDLGNATELRTFKLDNSEYYIIKNTSPIKNDNKVEIGQNPNTDSGRPISMVIKIRETDENPDEIYINCHMLNASILKIYKKSAYKEGSEHYKYDEQVYDDTEKTYVDKLKDDTRPSSLLQLSDIVLPGTKNIMINDSKANDHSEDITGNQVWFDYCLDRLSKTLNELLSDFGIEKLDESTKVYIMGDFNDPEGTLLNYLETHPINMGGKSYQFVFGEQLDTCCPNSNSAGKIEDINEVKQKKPFNRGLRDYIENKEVEKGKFALIEAKSIYGLTPIFKGDNIGKGYIVGGEGDNEEAKKNGKPDVRMIEEKTSDHGFVTTYKKPVQGGKRRTRRRRTRRRSSGKRRMSRRRRGRRSTRRKR